MSSGEFATLLSPFAIGGKTVRNRIMLTTHNPKMSEERYLQYLETRVAGGVGMVGIPVLNETISTLAYVTPGQLDGISARDLDGTADPETEEGRSSSTPSSCRRCGPAPRSRTGTGRWSSARWPTAAPSGCPRPSRRWSRPAAYRTRTCGPSRAR